METFYQDSSYSNEECQITNIPNKTSAVSTLSEPFDTIANVGQKCASAQSDVRDKETVKDDFVKTFTLLNKAKETFRDTRWHLKRLSEEVLPRCQSAGVTSDEIKRCEDQLKITRRFEPRLKKQSSKITNETKKLPESSQPSKSTFEKCSKKNVLKTNDSQQSVSMTSSLRPESIRKGGKNNSNTTVVSSETTVSDEKEINNYKVNNLSILRNPDIDVKPDLVTRKLSNIQIKPDNKTLCNCKPNVAYYEFTFESGPESYCKCQPLVGPSITNDKIVARQEIRRVLCGMLDNKSSNDSQNKQLINSQLQKIILKLDETEPSTFDDSNELENLVEVHSVVGFSETVVKKKLLEIAEHLIENNDNEISFDQMILDIEKNAHQVLQRLDTIKNSILTLNPTVEFPDISTGANEHGNVAKHTERIVTNRHLNTTINPKGLQDIRSDKYVSVGELLHRCSNNYLNSKMCSLVKSELPTTLFLKDHTIQNPIKSIDIITQNTVKNKNNTSELQNFVEPKSVIQSQDTQLKDYEIASKSQSINSSVGFKTKLKPFEEYLNKNQNKYLTTDEDNLEVDSSSKTNAETNTDSNKTYHGIELLSNERKLEINKNNSHLLTNNQALECADLKSNIEEWQLNSSSMLSNSDLHTELRTLTLD